MRHRPADTSEFGPNILYKSLFVGQPPIVASIRLCRRGKGSVYRGHFGAAISRAFFDEWAFSNDLHGWHAPAFRLGYGAQFIHVAAAMAENRTKIDDLLASCADPNARDAGGYTPLHYVAWNNPAGEVATAMAGSRSNYSISAVNAAFIEAALDAGADPAGSGEAVETARGTARYSCPSFGKTRVYRRLMWAGSRLRSRNKPGVGFHED